MPDTMTQLWFSTKNNHVLHHAQDATTKNAVCNQTIRPRMAETAHPIAELGDHAMFCPRCRAKLARAVTGVAQAEPVTKPEQVKPKRLTATQTWNCLTLLQREQIMAWFVATYAPARNAARFQLIKSPALTHAESIIAERWQGMEP